MKKHTNQIPYRASRACEVRAGIRCVENLPYQTIAKIFRQKIPYDEKKHLMYFMTFFEECYPELIKRFMQEQSISREQIIALFDKIPDYGEKTKFRKAIESGEF